MSTHSSRLNRASLLQILSLIIIIIIIIIGRKDNKWQQRNGSVARSQLVKQRNASLELVFSSLTAIFMLEQSRRDDDDDDTVSLSVCVKFELPERASVH